MGLGIGRRLKRGAKSVGKGFKRAGRTFEKGTKKLGKSVEKGVRTGGKSGVNYSAKIVSGGIPETIEATGDLLTPDINIPEPEQEAVMPIPDEELSRSARRRSRARRKGGRSSSILTGGDTLGGY